MFTFRSTEVAQTKNEIFSHLPVVCAHVSQIDSSSSSMLQDCKGDSVLQRVPQKVVPKVGGMALDLSPAMLYSAVALAATWAVLWWWKHNRQLPPGPWGLPLFGYFPFLQTTHTDFLQLSEKYGDVFGFRTVGGQLFVVLTGAKVIKEVLVNRADEFIGRIKDTNLVSWVSDGLGIAQEEGDSWSEHRRFFLQAAKNFGFGKLELEERIHDEVRGMLADIRQEGARPVRLSLRVAYVTNSVISHVLFGKKFKKDETFVQNVSDMQALINTFVGNRNMLVGSAFDLFFAVFPSLKQGRDSVRKFSDAVVSEQIRTRDANHPRGYVDAFLGQRDEHIRKGDGGTFTRNRLEASTMNLHLEGTESTGSTTVGLLMELSRHPAVQKKVQEELDSVVGSERLPSWADRQNLPYLDATIQELYRTKSQFPVTTIYSNFKETTINGFRIPERSAIVANLHSIHCDPEIYPEPEKFDPNRFLNSEGKRIKREGPYPFGLGKRSCIGESLAQMEVLIIVGSVMQSFTLQPGGEEETVRASPRK